MQAIDSRAPVQKAPLKTVQIDHAESTNAIVRITRTTICNTDLRILKGSVSIRQPGSVLGHEGVGRSRCNGSRRGHVPAWRQGADLMHHRRGRCEQFRMDMYSLLNTYGD